MATKWDKTPARGDNVLSAAAEDVEKAHKGMKAGSSNLKGGAQQSVKEAGGRAILRNLGRMGAANLATNAGLAIGEELEKRTGVGKKMVEESGLGNAVERMVKRRDKVELTPEARARIADGETEGMAKGGKVKGWGIARGARKAKIY